MVTGQASDRTTDGARAAISAATTGRLLNLLELSSSELTTTMGGDSLPVTGMLRDTLLSVLKSVRPDLLAHSQRVAFLCHGIARQCGWTSRKISTLTTAAVLHEIGAVIIPPDYPFWELSGTPVEDLCLRVSVDLLTACHADSELLETLALAQSFRYREPLPEESEAPTPEHVILGAAALKFANLFDAVRHRAEGSCDVAEAIAALKTMTAIPEEERIVAGLEEWLSGRDAQIENFDVNSLLPNDLEMDENTIAMVRDTFLDIVFELHGLEQSFDGFFILDATGRFLLWNLQCEQRFGKSTREMRNKHWTNQLIGYSNHEGFGFSDSQTPLYQTLETAKPANLTLFLKNPDEDLIETEVNSVPIIGRDGLLMGIIELHRTNEDVVEGDPEAATMFTPEWIVALVSELKGQENLEIPEIDDRYLVALEEKLGISDLVAPPEYLGSAVERLYEATPESEYDAEAAELTDTEEPPEEVPIEAHIEESIEELPPEYTHESHTESRDSIEEEQSSTELEVAHEVESAEEEERTEEELDDLFSRFDSLVEETEETLSEPREAEDSAEAPDESQALEGSTSEFSETTEVQEFTPELSVAEESAPESEIFAEEMKEGPVSEIPEPETVPETSMNEITGSLEEAAESVDEPLVEESSLSVEEVEAFVSEVEEPEAVDSAPEQVVPEEEPTIETAEESEQVAEDIEEEFAPEMELTPESVAEDHSESAVEEDVKTADAAEPQSSEEQSIEIVHETVEQPPVDDPEEEVVEEKEPPQSEPVSEEPAVEEDPMAVPGSIEMSNEESDTMHSPSLDPGETEPFAQPVSRKEWDAFVEHLIDPNSPDHELVGVLFLDIDRFKAINEGFGRRIGDDLITELSRRLSQACGKRELSCRYGGGQFAIACPGLTLDKAKKRGDQFRKLIDRTRFDVLPFHSLTVSVGITCSEQNDNLTELMNRVEHSLYQAKRSGRNCVVAQSSADIQQEMQAVEENMSKLVTKDFEVQTEFEAVIASDMIVYKLGGFLYDMHAKLLHVDRRHVSMRVGSKGFLPYWGRQDNDRPVLIDLELGEGWNRDGNDQGGHMAKTTIHVKIRPDGWVRKQETFLKRAHFVLRELKGYFVTN